MRNIREKFKAAIFIVAVLGKRSFNILTVKAKVSVVIALMSFSAASHADITLSGNISLGNPAPAGGVDITVGACDNSPSENPGNALFISFSAGQTTKPFSYTVSDAADAEWQIDVTCHAGCISYMDQMFYSIGQPDNTTRDFDLITRLAGGSDLSGLDFSLYGAKTISGNLNYPNGAPVGGMVIHVNVTDFNKPRPTGDWFQLVGHQNLPAPGGVSSVAFSVKVIDDFNASQVLEAYCYPGDNPANQCYEYVDVTKYTASGSTTRSSEADRLDGGINHTGKDFDILSSNHFQGMISLPNGVASGDVEIHMAVRGKNSNGNSDGTQSVTILNGASSVAFDLTVRADLSATDLIVRAQCESNCGDYENRSYYNDVLGQTALIERATEFVNSQNHTGINFSLVEKYSGAIPMCGVLLDDFSGQAVDLDDWSTPEAVGKLSGGKLQISHKLISRADKSTSETEKRFGVNLSTLPDAFEASITLTEADLTTSGAGSVFASLRGGYYYTLDVPDTPDQFVGLVWVGFYLGDRGSGLEAWWEILEGTDPDFDTYIIHDEGTLIAPGTLVLNTEYPMKLEYDSALKSFTFTLDGTSDSGTGPTEGTRSESDLDHWRRLDAGAVPDVNMDNDPISVQALFDDVKANGVLYDDFSGSTLNEAIWEGALSRREIESGKLRIEVIAESSTRRSVRARIAPKYTTDSTCLQGTVAIASSSDIPSGTRGRNRLDGYCYNAMHDQFSYDGYDGIIWAQISFEKTESGTLRAAAYAERAIGTDYDDTEHRHAVDMRKSINGLGAIVEGEMEMEMDPFSLALFVFCNTNRTIVKLVGWGGNGFILWMKRDDKARFRWSLNLPLNWRAT